MTSVYAHIHDKTLKKEIAKYHDNRVVNVAGEIVESTTPELDNDLDLHRLDYFYFYLANWQQRPFSKVLYA